MLNPSNLGVLGKDSDFLVYNMGEEKYYLNMGYLQFKRTPKGKCKVLCRAYDTKTVCNLLKLDKKVRRTLPLIYRNQ